MCEGILQIADNKDHRCRTPPPPNYGSTIEQVKIMILKLGGCHAVLGYALRRIHPGSQHPSTGHGRTAQGLGKA